MTTTTPTTSTVPTSRARRRSRVARFAGFAGLTTTAAAGLVAGPAATAHAGGPISGEGARGLAAVDELLQDYLDDHDLAGATVTITKGSRLVWSKGYGYADREDGIAMQPHHRARIGSTSKVITAIAAMQLVEDGALDLDQRVYGSLAPIWGSEWGAAPGVIVGSDGALDDPTAYATAMVAGVAALGDHFPPADHVDEIPSLNWALLLDAAYHDQVETVLARGSAVRVRNVLSTTVGYLNSASRAKDGAVAHVGVPLEDVTPAQHHQAVLLGTSGAPFRADPGTVEQYSNHGFSVGGLLIAEASAEGSYRGYVEHHLLDPLGVGDVVPNNAEYGALDAQPYRSDGSPADVDTANPSRLGLSTGGWTASARDLARIMCSTDQSANHLRSLEPATVALMAADAEPGASGTNPIGWDSSNGTTMSKNGSISGGSSRISKFLPGAFEATGGEINVAVAVNQNPATPSSGFLADLAEIAADADVAASYDLFDPAHRCRAELGLTTREEPPVRDPDPADPGRIVIRGVRVDPTVVRTADRAGGPCRGDEPAAVSADVAATHELASVELTWQIGDGETSAPIAMATQDGQLHTVELPPFDAASVVGAPADVALTVTATDTTGTTVSGAGAFTLRPCELPMRTR